jgi:hypothetical protein
MPLGAEPGSGIWKRPKYVELEDVCCRSLSELRWGCTKLRGAWDTGNTSPRSQQAGGLCSLGISVKISTTARTVVS